MVSNLNEYWVDSATQDKTFNFGRNDLNGCKYCGFTFTIPNGDTSPISIQAFFGYLKETDKLFSFEMQKYNSKGGPIVVNPGKVENTINFSNFSFDETTGRVKASFILNGPINSTKKDATVAGEIDVIVKRIVQ